MAKKKKYRLDPTSEQISRPYPPVLVWPTPLPITDGDVFLYIDVDELKKQWEESKPHGIHFRQAIADERPNDHLWRELSRVLRPIFGLEAPHEVMKPAFVPGSYQDRLRLAAMPRKSPSPHDLQAFDSLLAGIVSRSLTFKEDIADLIHGEAAKAFPSYGATKIDEKYRSLFAQGRSLVCSGYDGRYVCITLRSTESDYGPKSTAYYANGVLEHRKWKNEAGRFLPFPIIIETLIDDIFPTSHQSTEIYKGVIVVSGETGCGKTQITMGLIATCLQRLVAQNDPVSKSWGFRDSGKNPKRHHFLTIEDQIETFYKSEPDQSVSDEVRKAWSEGLTHPCIRDTGASDPTSPLVKERIYYTPRLIGRDVRTLQDGLSDALRQKPALVYLGEVRQSEDLKAMIDFGATGHLVVATMHAGSLTGTMEKLIRAYSGQRERTPAERGEVAQSILAAIHLQSFVADGARMIAPAVWRQSELGIAGLVGEGLGSILPHCVEGMPSHGRQYYLKKIRTRFQHNAHHLTHPENVGLFRKFEDLVANSDLGGI